MTPAAVPVGSISYTAGASGRALSLPLSSHVTFPSTGAVLRDASALTFSVWARVRESEHRTFLGCRSFDRGFEWYSSSAGTTNCAGDGSGALRGWGACESVAGTCAWSHFVLRWAGPGFEPEIAADGGAWTTMTPGDFPIGDLDLFDGAQDLVTGVGAGDGALAAGRLEVDEIRVYDVALPDETVWSITACPVP